MWCSGGSCGMFDWCITRVRLQHQQKMSSVLWMSRVTAAFWCAGL